DRRKVDFPLEQLNSQIQRLDFFLEVLPGLEKSEARAGAEPKEIHARHGPPLALNSSDRHSAPDQAIFLRPELSLGVSGQQQVHVQRRVVGDLLRFLEASMKNRENEFRLVPGVVRDAEELGAAAGDHQSQLKWPCLKEVEARFEVRQPEACAKRDSAGFVQLSYRASLHSHPQEHLRYRLGLSLLLRYFGLLKLRGSKERVAGVEVEDRPARALRFNHLKRRPIDAAEHRLGATARAQVAAKLSGDEDRGARFVSRGGGRRCAARFRWLRGLTRARGTAQLESCACNEAQHPAMDRAPTHRALDYQTQNLAAIR